MLKYILIETRLFRDGDQRLNAKALLAYLEALTYANEIYLDEHPDTSPLYQSGVTYALPEPFQKDMPTADRIYTALISAGVPDEMSRQLADAIATGEHFRDIPALLENGRGDCDNVSSMRAAELRSVGIDASVYLTEHKRPDGTTYHAIVRWPDGTGEDPSRVLGMGGRDHVAMITRVEELRRLAERRDNLAAILDQYRRDGRSLSGTEMARLKKLARLLQPPPATPEEVAGWEGTTARKNFDAGQRKVPTYLSLLPQMTRRAA